MNEVNETNKTFELYILGAVNKILENHKQTISDDYVEHVKNIQKYVKDAITPVLNQTAEIEKKNHQRFLIAEETNKARFEESEKKRTIQIRTQNACMLYATGKIDYASCVSMVMDFERAFEGLQ